MTFSELSGVTIVIFIAVGALILMLLFIFAKRQIMRFALRSRRGQLPVGHGAPRWLRKEIEQRLNRVSRVRDEPQLIHKSDDADQVEGLICPTITNVETRMRMKAIDDIKVLEIQLKLADERAVRQPGDPLRGFLLALLAAVLRGAGAGAVHQLCDLYERARFSPDSFTAQHLHDYRQHLAHLVQVAQANKNLKSAEPNPSPRPSAKGKRRREPLLQVSVL